ncbi:MAG: tetratricopeptide repeat protein [Flavobacteriales bacterium]
MDRERLTRLLEEPGRVAREDLGDLKALAERYPWFSGAQLLRVAGEQAAGDVLFDETLQSATAHLPSRAVLFDLVEKKGLQVPIPPRPEPRILRIPLPEPPPVVVRVELPDPEQIRDEVSTKEPVVPDRVEPQPAPVVQEAIEDPLERQILEAALASAYDLTWKEETTAPAVRKPLGTEQSEQSATPPPPALPNDVRPVVLAPFNEPPRISIGPSLRLRFTEWLGTAEPVSGAEPPVAPLQGTPPDAQDWLRGATPVVATSDPQPVAIATHELIDRFIQQQTPDPVRKAEFFTPQQAAKRSLDDTAGLVTETLARIYEKQGNLHKAIEAYGKLALKYPHKSDYFAALQKSLEEQLNK